MKQTLPDSLLAQLSESIATRTALHFPRERWGDLEHNVRTAAREFGFTDEAVFIKWLTSSSLTREQLEMLTSYLTINETYFWREPKVFEALEEQVLPELIRARKTGDKRLRIWSAGCSTGEEPYSIAIALRRVIPDLADWHITILATDINPKILRKARAGVYGEWSFRNVPGWFKGNHFRRREDGKFEIAQEIREMVTFAYLNLAEDVYPSLLNDTNAMDIIFCRNVLMYFVPTRAKSVGQNLYHSLAHEGWLMVGASELSQQTFPQFSSVHFSGAIVYRKDSCKDRVSEALHLETMLPRETGPVLWQSIIEAGQSVLPLDVQASEPPESVGMQSLDRVVAQESLGVDEPGERSGRATTAAVRVLANEGRLADALTLCDEAIAADRLDAGLHFLRATIFQEQKKEGEAIAAFKRALYLDQDFVLAHFALGNLVLRQGNARTAQKHFRNVLHLLSTCNQEDILPESGGLTVSRFREITHATIALGAPR